MTDRDARQWVRRTRNRTLGRAAMVMAAGSLALLLPVLLHATATWYVAHVGLAPGERLPRWLGLSFWAGEVAIAACAAVLLYRRSDEFERKALTGAAALAGGTLVLLMPPALFTSGYWGLYAADAMQRLWIITVVVGIIAYGVLLMAGRRA